MSAKFEINNAPCQSVNPEIFFPDPTDYVTIQTAKSLCAQCEPVTKSVCLNFSITNRTDYGIWGGLTEDERRSIQRKKQRHRYQTVIKEY